MFVVSPLFQYSAVLAWNFRIFLNYSNKTTKKTCLPSSKPLLLLLFRPLSLDSSEITCSCKYWPNLFFCNPFDDGRHWTDNWGEIVIKTNKFMLYLRCGVIFVFLEFERHLVSTIRTHCFSHTALSCMHRWQCLN